MEPRTLKLFIRRLLVDEVSNNLISSELMENSSVEYADRLKVDPDIRPHQEEETVFHHPKADIRSGVAAVSELIFE